MSLLKKIFGKKSDADKNLATKPIFETHKHKIYPWVKVFFLSDDDPRITQPQIELSAEDSPIKTDWLGDLCILYVVDMDTSFQVLLERDLPKNITKDQLHQLAVDNLNRDIEFTLNNTNFGAHMLTAGGDHEAGSICLPEIWEWLTEHFADNLIVSIPAKDLVIIVPECDEDKVANLKIFVHEIFKNGERLLTRNIFRFDRISKKWTTVDSVN